MKIGVIGAMPEEILLIKNKLGNLKESEVNGTTYYSGTLFNKDIVLVKCGVGKVNAAIITQTIINKHDVSYIINIGIAGALQESLNIADVVVSTDLVQHDVNAQTFGYDLGQVPSMDTFAFKADDKLISIAKNMPNIFLGRIASGDQFIAESKKKEFIKNTFNAVCVEMEGAAIAQTCYVSNIPFIVIRSISDRASGNAFSEFEENMDVAIKNSTSVLEKMVKEL